MANPNWGEMVTAALAERRPKISDAITRNNILMLELRRRGRIKTLDGGRTISQPIMLGDENTNFQWYIGRETLTVAGQEVLSSAEFPWKQYACAVSISGLEMLQNSGKNQIIQILSARMEHARKTIVNQMHKTAHGDGTSFSGKEMGGLALMISAVAGATVGGINSGVHGWWDNKRKSTGGAQTSTIYADMLDLWLDLCRGMDKPNLIISDNSYYSIFAQSQQQFQRYSSGSLARVGFSNIMFQTAPVVPDGGQGGYAPVGMKFLNTSTICLYMHSQRNNAVLGGPRRPLTEDSDTAIIAGMGNFAIDNRMLNGVLQD